MDRRNDLRLREKQPKRKRVSNIRILRPQYGNIATSDFDTVVDKNRTRRSFLDLWRIFRIGKKRNVARSRNIKARSRGYFEVGRALFNDRRRFAGKFGKFHRLAVKKA